MKYTFQIGENEEMTATLNAENNIILSWDGDFTAIDLIKPYFTKPIEVEYARPGKEEHNGKKFDIIIEDTKTLEPGDAGYIRAVVLNRLGKDFPVKVL